MDLNITPDLSDSKPVFFFNRLSHGDLGNETLGKMEVKGSPRRWICSHREGKERSVIIYYVPGFLPSPSVLSRPLSGPRQGLRSHSIPDEKPQCWEMT